MRRRDFMTLLGGAAAWPLAARGQQLGKVWRIGMLDMIAPTGNSTNLEAFRKGLRELGYVEGQNLAIEYRSADGRSDEFPNLATELVRLKIDLFVTRGTPAALAAKGASETIPIVMAAIAEPSVLVSSIAHPNGNVTGLSSLYVDVTPKRFELLKEVVPVFSRVGYLGDVGNPAATLNSARKSKLQRAPWAFSPHFSMCANPKTSALRLTQRPGSEWTQSAWT